jgi:polar amino acid transport system substrate-binding protein
MRFRALIWLVAVFTLLGPPVHAEEATNPGDTRRDFVAAAVPDRLPLAARDAAGTLQGFDIEVAEEIAKRLGGGVTFVTPGWEQILSGRWDGQWDYAVASITPTERRKENLDFPGIYRFDAAVLIVRQGDKRIAHPAEASGKSIGVMADTTFQKYLQHNLSLYPDAAPPVRYVIDKPQIRTYPNNEAAIQALVNGKVETVLTTFVTAKEAIERGLPIQMIPGFLYLEPVAVAIAKGDPSFAARIQESVDAMRQDGSLAAMSIKWLGIDLSSALP